MAIKLINKTPFTSGAWDYLNQKGNAYGVALLRGRFTLQQDEDDQWQLVADVDQGELFSEDRFYGKPDESSLQYETDYISYKSGTDIVANCTARVQGKPKTEWKCGIQVLSEDKKILCSKILTVTGKREWKGKLLRWKLTKAKPCREVAIRYEAAYGGSSKKYDSNGKFVKYLSYDKRNPIGVGNNHSKEKNGYHVAPQIESLKQPIGDFYANYSPQGFGFVHRTWQPRLKLAGTYDDKWLKEKHPLLPDDFDLDYNRSASEGMALKHYLKGGEEIKLKNFLSKYGMIKFKLPLYSFYSSLTLSDGGLLVQPLELDTVLLDIETDDINDWRIYLSWRGQHILPDNAAELELFGIENTKKEKTTHGIA